MPTTDDERPYETLLDRQLISMAVNRSSTVAIQAGDELERRLAELEAARDAAEAWREQYASLAKARRADRVALAAAEARVAELERENERLREVIREQHAGRMAANRRIDQGELLIAELERVIEAVREKCEAEEAEAATLADDAPAFVAASEIIAVLGSVGTRPEPEPLSDVLAATLSDLQACQRAHDLGQHGTVERDLDAMIRRLSESGTRPDDQDEPPRLCESNCGCRYGTNDPDRFDCACDGPCTMADPEVWGCLGLVGASCGHDCPRCPSAAAVSRGTNEQQEEHERQHRDYGTWPCAWRDKTPNPCPILAEVAGRGSTGGDR